MFRYRMSCFAVLVAICGFVGGCGGDGSMTSDGPAAAPSASGDAGASGSSTKTPAPAPDPSVSDAKPAGSDSK
jgi:hypothetical protein